jgi:hypothetical protein
MTGTMPHHGLLPADSAAAAAPRARPAAQRRGAALRVLKPKNMLCLKSVALVDQ